MALKKLLPGLCLFSGPPGVSSLFCVLFVYMSKKTSGCGCSAERGVRNVWKGDDDSGGKKKPSEVFGCWAVAALTHTKLSSEPLCLSLFPTLSTCQFCSYTNQSGNFKNQAENVAKDGYVFSRSVLDRDTSRCNRQALNGCLKALK